MRPWIALLALGCAGDGSKESCPAGDCGEGGEESAGGDSAAHSGDATDSDDAGVETGGQDSTPDSALPDTGPDPDTPLELCINEFMPDNEASWADETGAYPDWVELHNPGTSAVSLDGWTMTDDRAEPDKHVFGPELTLEPGDYLLLSADEQVELGSTHLAFSLAAEGEEIALYAPDGRGSIVTYGEITADMSAARVPDCCVGTGCWAFEYRGTPGETNVELIEVETPLVSAGATWAYWDVGSAPDGDWTSTDYDDSVWPTGPAPLGYGDTHIVTAVSYGADPNNKYITTWFRLSFEVEDPAAFVSLAGTVMYDDGAVVYLNGTEVTRGNMPEGEITADTLASTSVSDETAYNSFEADLSLLNAGTNVLAVELHQAAVNSSDAGFDLTLAGVELVSELDTGSDTGG